MTDVMIERISECPVTTAIGIIAGKWKPTILSELGESSRRFSDLKRDIPGISDKVLTGNLRDLEADGIVSRRKFREGAVLATEYALTGCGLALKPILNALEEWSVRRRRLAS
jgi:DNA-binding HxlR family transcriptional regulator